ncbi:apoptotic chromatin condensation inducer in the nucleus isoform X1 [Phymastichus coffea]|uniref:apoptotic chromatin condensation inducer in the nucleus isoform X1 n=1 Tax=Phymastichus coffea TaxID=108790 RepID=UPI00273B7C3F|nr:apoptotic chromatin condensation inducer in the nucleus isoform X1 [Phymastichus coffea]
MFKCCVCHGKTSRRTSQEEDDDDSSRESSSSSTSSSSSPSSSGEEDEDEEERQIEEELAKKFKCQNPNTREPLVAGGIDTVKEEDEEDEEEEEKQEENERSSATGKVVVEVNGDVRGLREDAMRKSVDREAIREDVVEILNSAVKIVRERLEKIKEETPEDNSVEESLPATAVTAAGIVESASGEEIDRGASSATVESEKSKSDESEEEVVTVVEEDGVSAEVPGEQGQLPAEHEITEEIKKEGLGLDLEKTHQIEEMIIEELIDALNEEADNDQELKEIMESATTNEQPIQPSNEEAAIADHPVTESRSDPAKPVQEEAQHQVEDELLPPPPYPELEIVEQTKKSDASVSPVECDAAQAEVQQTVCPSEETPCELTNGDLLNIPPPISPPPEDKDRSSSEMSFPTPPPIDFDIAETDQEDSEPESELTKKRTPSPCKAPPPAPPSWDEEVTPPNETAQQTRRLSKTSSPGSKSLPSPPSPGSDAGNETEACSSSKSSSDEQTTTKLVPSLSKATYAQRTIDDDDGDDSVFETVSLAKDPEVVPEDIPPRPVPPVPRWLSQEEEDPESHGSEVLGGMQEPPATPVARDELALRRHRFFSDLLQAARSTAEHRVSFDPLGPMVHPGCEHDDREEHLEELVNRLENVTKRLEQVSVPQIAAVQTQEIAVQTKSPSPERSLSITEEISQSSSSSSRSTVSGASVVEVVKSMSVASYENLLAGPVQEYIQLSQQIGGDVAAHAKIVDKAFQIQLEFLRTAASRPAPANQSEQMSLLIPTSRQIQEIQEFREKHRGSPFFNHLSAISESIPALGWVAVTPTPAPYVKEMNDAGQFYTNRVLKDWKEKDKTHVEWCKTWVKTLTDLQQFVRQHHTTGLVWAKTGSVPAGGVPPPPPPCMMPMADPAPAVGDDRSALFAEINQGENITKHLKKVTSDMQTHKNASLRTGPAPFKAPVVSNSGTPGKTTLPANAPIDKPPVFTRDGKKWLVEYQKGNKNLLVENAEMNNVVYMFRCQDSNLVVKGKINSVVIDSCRKCAVVFDSVVASVEFVNCQSVQMQVLGKVPTISVDKTDGCQMYLNKDTLDVELITSKSSEMNVMVPVGNGDYTEYPVPEQFKTVITPKGLNTVAVDSLG